jgi:hypothetical protein
VSDNSPYTHSICTQNALKLTQHSTAQITMYIGSFATVARESSCVVSMADTRSHSVEEQLVAFHAVTAQML